MGHRPDTTPMRIVKYVPRESNQNFYASNKAPGTHMEDSSNDNTFTSIIRGPDLDSLINTSRCHSAQQPKKEEQAVLSNIQNGDMVNFYFNKVLMLDSILMGLHIIALLLSILYAEGDYWKALINPQLFLLGMFWIMVITLIITYLRYKGMVELEISRFELADMDTIWSSDKWKWLLVEASIVMFQPFPFINDLMVTTTNLRDNYDFEFKVNYCLVLISFTKIFVICKIYLSMTYFMTPRANRVSKMYEATNDYLYAIKGKFMDQPMTLIVVCFSISIFCFALSLRIAERKLLVEDRKHGVVKSMDLEDMVNAIWFTIITMTTVGYGDYYPRTMFGRVIDFILIVWGSIVVSLMVVVLTNSLTMDMSEKRAVAVLNRLDLKTSEKTTATSYIANYWRKHKLENSKRRVGKGHSKQMTPQYYKAKIEEHAIKQHNYAQQKKNINQKMQSMLEVDDLYEQLTRHFDSFMDEVDESINNQIKVVTELIGYVNEKTTDKNKTKYHKQE